MKNCLHRSLGILALVLACFQAAAHPGSGIVVDRHGRVFFTDTGQGIWRLELSGEVKLQEGPAYHWMTIDPHSGLRDAAWPQFVEPSTRIEKVGADPMLLVGSDFPLTTAPDGALYYPEFSGDHRLRVYRTTPSGDRAVLANLDAGADGKELKWLNGMAAGPDGSIYFTENAAVRRITPQGNVSTVAQAVTVENCQRLPGADERLGPLLRGLDVASDGTIYVAANGCSALLKITPEGRITPLFRPEAPWSPTGVAISRANEPKTYVLEYLHTAGGDRRDWLPRVREISTNGQNRIIARVERSGTNTSRAISSRSGSPAGGE